MIIAISGKKGVGKTSAANYVAKQYGYQKISFSTALKDLAKHIFPQFTESMLNGELKEVPQTFLNGGGTPREFLEKLGQFLRYWDKDYWLKEIDKVISFNPHRNYVCDDCRFPNEVEYFKGLGGTIVRINRYPSQNPYREDSSSPSEISLDNYKFDYVVNECDNVDLYILYSSVKNIMKRISGE